MTVFDFLQAKYSQNFKETEHIKHQPTGYFFTFLIISIVTAWLIIMVYSIYQRREPVVLYKERQVESPKQYIMNSQTLPFAFGMEDATTFQNYIDPAIYTVISFQQTKIIIINSYGISQEAYTRTNDTFHLCTEENFQNQSTKNGFFKLPLKDLCCFQLQSQKVIEGDLFKIHILNLLLKFMHVKDRAVGIYGS